MRRFKTLLLLLSATLMLSTCAAPAYAFSDETEEIPPVTGGVETQPLTKTVTTDSATGDLGEILKQLAPEIEAETEDGYAGMLKLDYNSVQAEVKGYKTSTRNLSASRTYPNLSSADATHLPKTISDGGRTMTLQNVKCQNPFQ